MEKENVTETVNYQPISMEWYKNHHFATSE